jgi:hypothetical protein
LPVPKPPGTDALPPLTTGNNTSSTRWPVSSGSVAVAYAVNGRDARTGHHVRRLTSVAPTRAIGSSAR